MDSLNFKNDKKLIESLGKSLISLVRGLPEKAVNKRLRDVIARADSLLDVNVGEALGILSTIAPMWTLNDDINSENVSGFTGPQAVYDMSDSIRHGLRMRYVEGIETYSRLMTDRNYNYVLDIA